MPAKGLPRIRCYVQVFVAFLAYAHLIAISAAPCPHVSLRGKKGRLMSPMYPKDYPNNKECSWDIRVPRGHIIKLQFYDFLTERNFGCSNDYVKVFDGPNKSATMLGKYCGGMQPFAVMSTKNAMYIKFYSDNSLQFRGFRAGYIARKQNHTTSPPRVTQGPVTGVKTTVSTTVTPSTSIPTATKTKTTQRQIPTTVRRTPTTVRTVVTTPKIMLSFVSPLGNHTIAVGMGHKFVCHVRGTKKRVPITWFRRGVILTDDDQGHIKILKINRRKSILEIKGATKKDSGGYGCHADVGNADPIYIYGFLSVKDPPIIEQGPLSQKVFAGEMVKMTCKAGGDPPLNIRWYIDGRVSSHLENQQKYTSSIAFRAERTAMVECLVYNSLGRDFRKATATVMRAPVTIAETIPIPAIITVATLNQTADIGENITLRCSARGTPPMKIRWFIDNKYYEVKQFRNKENIYTSFFVMTVKKEYTVVKCLAQNPYGIDNKSGVIRPVGMAAVVAEDPWNKFLPGQNMFYIVVVGGMAALIIVLVGVICIRRQRASQKYKPPSPVSLEQLTKNPIFERNSNTYVNPKLEKWELHRNNIEFIKDLEDGAYSRLFLGKMTHATRGEQDALVMVKVLKESTPTDATKDYFEEEAIVLTTYEHPNVQSLLGVCVIGRPLCLIFECSNRGDLNQFLRDCGCSHYIIRERPNSSLDPDSKLSHLDQFCIAKQIAAGMEYLASKAYIHKQLCTKNCMVNKTMVVKIANIGVSEAAPNTAYFSLNSLQRSKYPVRWLPLESINSGIFNDNTDIWSFGIVLWEIYSYGITPYYGMNNDEVISLVREGDILPRPKECPKEMYDLMQDCWSLVPHKRPRFRFLHKKISALFTGVAV